MFTRNKTPPEYVYRGLYLYFSGLSLRRTSQRLSCFIKRNHVTIWNWIQKYHPEKISTRSKRISEFIVDETLLKVGSEYIWLWVAIDAKNKEILALFQLINPKRETCLSLRDSYLIQSKHMEDILFQLMVEHGTQWHVDS